MSRTFIVGQAAHPVREREQLVRQALERARAAVRPGISGWDLHTLVCELFEAAGHRTLRTGPARGTTPTKDSSTRSGTA
jgi:Xaa-Pro aminopeptidase